MSDKPKRRRSPFGVTVRLTNHLALFFGQERTTTFRNRIALALIHGDIGTIRTLTDKHSIDWSRIYANLCGTDPAPFTSVRPFYGLNREAMAYVQQLANSEVEYPEPPKSILSQLTDDVFNLSYGNKGIDMQSSAAFWKSLVENDQPYPRVDNIILPPIINK